MKLQINHPTPLPQSLRTNIPLHDKTFFRTGGPAAYFSEPTTVDELQYARTFAHDNSLPIFILGSGANILISDEGCDGLVIKPHMTNITITDDLVTAEAGTTLNALIITSLEHQLGGLEVFSGIPGTVGGSTYINVHYFEHGLSDFIVSGQVMNVKTGEITTVDAEWFQFGYDQSKLFDKQHILVSTTFKLAPLSQTDAAFALGRRHEIIRHRERRYPKTHTCGSFFRNFTPDEVTLEINGRKMIFIAYYLDKLGMKGELTAGDAIISYQHANMIINRGTATSHDIITLARTMQQKVFDAYGIIPQPECQLVGFSKYPLL